MLLTETNTSTGTSLVPSDPFLIGFAPQNQSRIYVNTDTAGKYKFFLGAMSEIGNVTDKVEINIGILPKDGPSCVIRLNATEPLVNISIPMIRGQEMILLKRSVEQFIRASNSCDVINYELFMPE